MFLQSIKNDGARRLRIWSVFMRNWIYYFTFLLFFANLFNGFVPEHGRNGGWDYSVDAANRDCREYGRRARIYDQDADYRLYFECVK